MTAAVSIPEDRTGHILFVDDDADVVKAAALLLSRHGLRVTGACDPREARSRLAAERIDVVLLDLNFTRGATSGEEGFRCLQQLLADDPQAVVVVITAHSGISVAVRAMQAGASDFVMKPWNNARLLATVQDALELRRRLRRTADVIPDAEPEPTILGESAAIARVRSLIARAGPTEAPVLVLGEAGLGKSLAARRLHLASRRNTGPFVTVDLAGLGAEEAERALFADRLGEAGALAQAEDGTLVLDEVADLAPPVQGRLISALVRSGPNAARIVSTSRRRRSALQGRGGLRDDLLYHLNTVEMVLPPMAERGGDAVLLAEHFLRLFAGRHGRPLRPLSQAAHAAVLASPWAGGVRVLRQAMERCVIFAEGPAYEPLDLGLEPAARAGPASAAESAMNLQLSERSLVAAALKRHSFNVSHAARELGLTRPALYRRMAKHGL
jgi:DNA-binding NtrC family response regulator